VSRVLRPTRHIIGHFRDESFQAITCTGTDKPTRKKCNEDRPISLLGKCRAMHLFAINIKCMQIRVGVPSEKVHLPPIPAPINPKCTCFHFLLIFRLTDRENSISMPCAALARQPSQDQCVLLIVNTGHWLRVTIKDGSISVFLQN